jgi:CubicO group peptidase (beta-lactamase class C family)
LVVSLAAGRDVVRDRPYPRDPLTRVASCSKGVVATAYGVLIEKGLVDPEALVSRYWPDYGSNGKKATTVEMVASHQAGIPFPALGSGLTGVGYFAGEALRATLAAQPPAWEPGTAVAYHGVTAGTVLDAICYGATGKDLSQIIREEIAEPLEIDMWLGLPRQLLPRVVPGAFGEDFPAEEPGIGRYAELRRKAMTEVPAFEPPVGETEAFAETYAAKIPGVGVVTNARSLAKMYAATVGAVGGRRLFGDATLRSLTRSRTAGKEMLIESGTAGPDLEFGFGYQLVSGSMPGFGPRTFGHTGMGGRLAVADPDLGIAFAFVCSSMRVIGPDGDPRWPWLLDAVKDAVS